MARKMTNGASAQQNDLDLLMRLMKRAKIFPLADPKDNAEIIACASKMIAIYARDPKFGITQPTKGNGTARAPLKKTNGAASRRA